MRVGLLLYFHVYVYFVEVDVCILLPPLLTYRLISAEESPETANLPII